MCLCYDVEKLSQFQSNKLPWKKTTTRNRALVSEGFKWPHSIENWVRTILWSLWQHPWVTGWIQDFSQAQSCWIKLGAIQKLKMSRSSAEYHMAGWTCMHLVLTVKEIYSLYRLRFQSWRFHLMTPVVIQRCDCSSGLCKMTLFTVQWEQGMHLGLLCQEHTEDLQ